MIRINPGEQVLGFRRQLCKFSGWRTVGIGVLRWFDADAAAEKSRKQSDPRRIDWVRCLPFLIIHLGCLGVGWVGFSWIGVMVCLGSFWLRMFAITAFYHRYFSHRSFKANRIWQCLFAVLGNTAAQRGPLWWASHHRLHHHKSDKPEDIHSPITHNVLWSHIGWFMSHEGYQTRYELVKDFAQYPELRFLNRFDALVPLLYACGLFLLGTLCNRLFPESGFSGAQFLIWGFFVSTTLLFHATFSINSLAHIWGKRRFKTKDHSRNNVWLALLTLGEGWHNNHHRYPVSVKQGFYWYEIDISYWILKLMGKLGVVHTLNPVPARILNEGKQARENKDNHHVNQQRSDRRF